MEQIELPKVGDKLFFPATLEVALVTDVQGYIRWKCYILMNIIQSISVGVVK